EKKGRVPRAQWQITNFRQCLLQCGLQDIGFHGNTFTWCKRRAAPNIMRARLDCVCSAEDWAVLFPSARDHHESVASSDHKATKRKARNEVRWLKDEGGRKVHNLIEIRRAVQNYFEKIFRTTAPTATIISEAIKVMVARMTDEMNAELVRPFSLDKVHLSLN
ncbi:UNVERIFIED_CONTAM: hypothetical protein Slati_3696100, partial [Sesamum latifolium]